MIRRLIDISVAIAGLTFGLPILILTSICVRLTMGSPVLFRQARAGLMGTSFILLKFRTMKEPVRGAGDDEARERITAFGQFLRSWSLDELPQLWNVLVGDMSLIGPRPLLLDYLPLYSPRQMRAARCPSGPDRSGASAGQEQGPLAPSVCAGRLVRRAPRRRTRPDHPSPHDSQAGARGSAPQ